MISFTTSHFHLRSTEADISSKSPEILICVQSKMVTALPLLIANFVCSFLPCEIHNQPPYISFTMGKNYIRQGRALDLEGSFQRQYNDLLVHTKSGTILGKKLKISDNREVRAFTGVPFGETTAGRMRFRDPVLKKPWKGIWDATFASPGCLQMDPVLGGKLIGSENCLHLDIYAKRSHYLKGRRFPVIFWIPGGANIFGTSSYYGPSLLLKEDLVLVLPNFRLGAFGFLSTGDAASPGNWALKDISLALNWTIQNIEAFGGDPNRIIIGGLSSGAHAAHSFLFTNHEVKNRIKGIIALSGSVLTNSGLDATGRVQRASDKIARIAGCPTAAEGKSFEMVECLRRRGSLALSILQFSNLIDLPPASLMLSPTVEPDVPGAFITELPETLYEKGMVPKIPLIATRTTDETCAFLMQSRFTVLSLASILWENWIPKSLKLGFRCCKAEQASSREESLRSLRKITKFYFNTTTPSVMLKQKDFLAMVKLLDDTLLNAALWKALEYHHRIAPTYSYIFNLKTHYHFHPLSKVAHQIFLRDFSAFHGNDLLLLFDYTNALPPLKPGSDFEIASRNLINFISNFATYGKPLYRNSKGELLPLWKPIESMSQPLVLDVGLVHNISMIRDPLVGSGRLEVWRTAKF